MSEDEAKRLANDEQTDDEVEGHRVEKQAIRENTDEGDDDVEAHARRDMRKE